MKQILALKLLELPQLQGFMPLFTIVEKLQALFQLVINAYYRSSKALCYLR